MIALVKWERLRGRSPLTHGRVVGQVWRGGHGRQAILAHLLPGVDVVFLDERLGKRAGVLLRGATRLADVVAAVLVLLAEDGDEIHTADVDELRGLAAATGTHVVLISA